MAINQPADAFWDLTLKEMGIIQNGVLARMRREHDERAWLAWHTAALPKMKKMPELRTLLSKGPGVPKPKQHWKAQEAILASWG